MMFHTGLHEDYHRPSDDAPKLNVEGIQRITQLLLGAVLELADAEQRQRFRTRAQQELKSMREANEAGLAPLPGRFGVRWANDDDGRGGIRIIEVTRGTAAAAAGLDPGDRIVEFAGQKVEGSAVFCPWCLRRRIRSKRSLSGRAPRSRCRSRFSSPAGRCVWESRGG